MRKSMKKAGILVLMVASVITLAGCQFGKGKTLPGTGSSAGNGSFVSQEGRLAHTLNTATSEYQERTFSFAPIDTAEIHVSLERKEGNIEIAIEETGGENFFLVTDADAVDGRYDTTIPVEEGGGTYEVQVTTENFKGTYDVSWGKTNAEVYETFRSSQGYTLQYNPQKFEVKTSAGQDTFMVKGEDDRLFLSIKVIAPNMVSAEKASILTEDKTIGDCILAKGTLMGRYAIREATEGITQRTYVVELKDGRGLIMESNYTSHSDSESQSPEEMRMNEMIKSLEIH